MPKSWLVPWALVMLCGCAGQSEPFVDLMLSGLPGSATMVETTVTLGSDTRMGNFSGNDMLNHITVSLPPDARGTLAVSVVAKDGGGCVVATGTASVELVENANYDAQVPLVAVVPPACTPVTLTVQNQGDGQGVVVSNPQNINCGAMCSAPFPPGTVVTLTATPQAGTATKSSIFSGFNGCQGTMNSCTVTLIAPTTVTAIFTCKGFCPENPATETNNLNAVWGSSSTSIVAVGDGGTILRWDGMSWRRIASGVTANLRGVSGPPLSVLVFAVGDGGTILGSQNGGAQWVAGTSTTTANLRGVALGTISDGYAVGDNLATGQPFLHWDGTNWTKVNASNLDVAWNAISFGGGRYIVGGNGGKHVRIAGPFLNASPAPSTTQNFNGAWIFDTDNQFLVGDAGTVMRYTASSTTWSTVAAPGGATTNLRAVYGTSATNMYVVGDGGTLWKYGGSTLSVVATGVTQNLNGVWALSDGNIYAVGQGGLILHYRP